MRQSQAGDGDEWEQTYTSFPFLFSDDEHESRAGGTDGGTTELEPGWRAARALMEHESDELLAVMLRPSFRPVRDVDLVPVERCPHCLDGGLRMAGTVRVRRGRVPVRACDTCAALDIGSIPPPSAKR